MKLKHILFSALLSLLLFSCKQEQFLYNSANKIHFGPEPDQIYFNYYELSDTVKSYNFYYSNVTQKQDTLFFNIYAVGGTADVDRAFKLEQVAVPGANNAVAGKHYEPFNSPSLASKYVIKKGTVHTRVPIVVLRDTSLKSGDVTLKFEVVANENFEPGIPSKLWRKVYLTDRLGKPQGWNDVTWGPYSLVKHAFFIEKSGQKWDNAFIASIITNSDLVQDWKTILKAALIDYNQQNPTTPLTDENGNLVKIP